MSQVHMLEPRETKGSFVLPVGILWEGRRYREIRLREMTGEEEDILASEMPVETKFATILANCTEGFMGDGAPERVTPSLMMRLPLTDRNYALICLRILSVGKYLEMKVKCPKCGWDQHRSLDLTKLEVQPLVDKPLVVTLGSGRRVGYRIATSEDSKWGSAAALALKLERPSVSILLGMFLDSLDSEVLSKDMKHLSETMKRLKGLSFSERSEIREYANSLGGDFDRTLEFECEGTVGGEECRNVWKLELEVGVDFFYPRE